MASVHSKLRMEKADMTRRMIAAVENPHVDILGHCTGRRIVGRPRPQSSFDHEAVFAACAASGTAVEIEFSSRPPRPARRTAPGRSRGRLPILDRFRRSRPRPALVAPAGLRTGGRSRGTSRIHCQHQAARGVPGLGGAPLTAAIRALPIPAQTPSGLDAARIEAVGSGPVRIEAGNGTPYEPRFRLART